MIESSYVLLFVSLVLLGVSAAGAASTIMQMPSRRSGPRMIVSLPTAWFRLIAHLVAVGATAIYSVVHLIRH